MKSILILEDDAERIASFRRAIVAAEAVLDALGYMEVRPGKPASSRIWLPTTLPQGF